MASVSDSNRWPEMQIVLLSSRAFHIHSRRSRPTGMNCTRTVLVLAHAFITLSCPPGHHHPATQSGCNPNAIKVGGPDMAPHTPPRFAPRRSRGASRACNRNTGLERLRMCTWFGDELLDARGVAGPVRLAEEALDELAGSVPGEVGVERH